MDGVTPAAFLSYFDFSGKTALVTGASSGLGYAIALRLAQQGCNVVLAARRTHKLEELCRKISALPATPLDATTSVGAIQPGTAKVVTLDVGGPEDAVEKAVGEAWDAFGRIDFLINNAGVGSFGPALGAPAAEWEKTLAVNIRGLALVLRCVSKRMVACGLRGSILNIASVLGSGRGTLPSSSMYSASKAAVIEFSKVTAIELGPHGIRVNSIAPGYFPSEMNISLQDTLEKHGPELFPLKRCGVTDPDLTGPVLFLLSEGSAYITGANLIVDGGYSLHLLPLV